MPEPATEPAASAPANPDDAATAGDRASRRAHRLNVAAWAVFAAVAAYVLWGTATHDFRDEPLAGDQSAHLLQTLSLAYDTHTLNFDARDMERWRALGWSAEPVGLFFQRYDDDLYGFAKPYGYSLYLAPFVAALGPASGIAIGNTLLLALLMAISVLLLRTRYRGPAVPLTVGAFFLASYPYMYAYWTHTELFLALLVLVAFSAAVRFAQTGGAVWGLLAFAAMGFGMSEKGAFAALFAPIALVMLWKAPRAWMRVAMPVAGVAVFAVAIVPYLHYSDWESFTPYGGDKRLYVKTAAPFGGGPEDGYAHSDFAASSLTEKLTEGYGDKAKAAAYTVAGRYTGIVAFLPLALLLVLAALARLRKADAWGRAAVLSVLGYALFYAVVFPTNYFGGGHALGNRYFLQAAPAVLAMVVLVGLSRRVLIGSSIVGGLLAIALLWPQHKDPAGAHVQIEKAGRIRRHVLPVESNQQGMDYVRCNKADIGHVTACH